MNKGGGGGDKTNIFFEVSQIFTNPSLFLPVHVHIDIVKDKSFRRVFSLNTLLIQTGSFSHYSTPLNPILMLVKYRASPSPGR